MQTTFDDLSPANIIGTYVDAKTNGKDVAAEVWKAYGDDTIDAMQKSTHLLAVLWESAWKLGGREAVNIPAVDLTKDRAMEICGDRKFLPSVSINQISDYLT